MQPFPLNLSYEAAGPVINEFHGTDARVRCLQGPLGSGKTTACVWEVLFRSMMQEPNKDRLRQTCWIVLKNTYKQMWRVVMPLWFKVFPRECEFTEFNQQYMWHKIKIPLPDNTIIDMVVYFISADKANEEDFKGINATAVWACEGSDISPGAINAAFSRWGRYPQDDKGNFFASWHGGIIDTNPPDTDDWLYKVFDENRANGYLMFKQPSGLSPNAENMRSKSPTYYQELGIGKSKAWIDIFVHGKEGFAMDGKLVFPEYMDDLHYSRTPLLVGRSRLVIGVDFGLTPSAIFLQQDAVSRIYALDEICLWESGVTRLADAIKRKLAERFHNFSNQDIIIVGDPAGNQRSQIDGISTTLQVLQAYTGITTIAAPTNSVDTRFEAVRLVLNKLIDAKPAFIIDPSCKMLRKGFNGKYILRTLRGPAGEKYAEEPADNEYTHIQDCLQYGLLQLGQARELLQGPSKLGVQSNDFAWDQTNQRLAKEADWRYSW